MVGKLGKRWASSTGRGGEPALTRCRDGGGPTMWRVGRGGGVGMWVVVFGDHELEVLRLDFGGLPARKCEPEAMRRCVGRAVRRGPARDSSTRAWLMVPNLRYCYLGWIGM